MTSFAKVAVGGLLWLSFSAAAFGSTLFNITGQPNSIDNGGGQFTAYLGPVDTQNLLVYCVDDLNFINVPSTNTDNITDLANMPAYTVTTNNFTRYGETAPGSFTPILTVDNPPPSVTMSDATAQDRYAMAAWLITQYAFPVSGATNAQLAADDEIQNAIWTILDATSTVHNGCPDSTITSAACTAGISAQIGNAQAWINGQISAGTLMAFENTVVIYSDANIAGQFNPARYSGTTQEMIGFTTTPEPATLAMLGAGLMAIGLLSKPYKVR
jgi:hypothetical protein